MRHICPRPTWEPSPAVERRLEPQDSSVQFGEHRVFVSNMGGECQNFNSPGFNFGIGQPLRHGQVSAAVPTAYDGLYSALKDWGRFELVLTPSDADLVFQIRVVCPSSKKATRFSNCKSLTRRRGSLSGALAKTPAPPNYRRTGIQTLSTP
ncbi:MAG TPA: hypothetical protein VH302_11640 [Bryobacteraceae bacterium]|nr:hypothetical protein [Bryobacteraceae bacterium]